MDSIIYTLGMLPFTNMRHPHIWALFRHTTKRPIFLIKDNNFINKLEIVNIYSNKLLLLLDLGYLFIWGTK